MEKDGVGECFFRYRPTRVVPDQKPLNGCVFVCHSVGLELSVGDAIEETVSLMSVICH